MQEEEEVACLCLHLSARGLATAHLSFVYAATALSAAAMYEIQLRRLFALKAAVALFGPGLCEGRAGEFSLSVHSRTEAVEADRDKNEFYYRFGAS